MSPPHAIFYEASHWPSGLMIKSRPLICQHPPPFPGAPRGFPRVFPGFYQGFTGFFRVFSSGNYNFLLRKIRQPLNSFTFFEINQATSPKLYWSYYPHWSRDSLSPVCGTFSDWIQGYMYSLGRRGLHVSNSPVSS